MSQDSKATVLCVDDEPDSLRVISMAIEEMGYGVLAAPSGREALDVLERQAPDLIIADLRMPNMNGFELFLKVKKDPRYTNTPFFFLTAVDDPLAVKYGKELGVDAYITKPVDLRDLQRIIEEFLARHRQP
jgi:CheY-like chemotaxis protein